MTYVEEVASGTIRRPEASGSERPLVGALGAGFLPWLMVVWFTAGVWTALQFVVYVAITVAAGYSILLLALPAAIRAQKLVLAPALGILAISALSALWLRFGLSAVWIPVFWAVLALTGAAGLWTDRTSLSKQRLAYGWSIAALSALVCLVYFLPSARNDAVYRSDGSFNWIYVDTQHFHAMAAGIKDGESPPVGPGTATEQLRYHFGSYVPAAILSRVTGIELGDALARVTRGASLWALLLSCLGLGSAMSIKATGNEFGGIASTAGLFFYGSLLSLFSNEASSASHVVGAILFAIPGVEVSADGGPFSHLVLGHSVLHGLIAITSIMGLCLAGRQGNVDRSRQALLFLALPALAIPVNSVAALYSLAVVGILLFWGRLTQVRSWLGVALMLAVFLAVWYAMGLYHAPDSAGAALKSHIAAQWWALVVGFIVGLGFRIVAFRWIAEPLRDPLRILFLATVLGLLSFSVLLQIGGGNERYGIYYLECMFSLFAFCRLSPGFWRSTERTRWVMEWLGVAQSGLLALIVAGASAGILAHATHTHTGISSFVRKMAICLLSLLVLSGTSILMKRSLRFSQICSAAIAGVLSIGFLAWITPWKNFGMGRMKMDVTLSAGEVQGLHRLRILAKPGEEFATNKHAVATLATRQERSYGYAALSERPVLLEGYLDRGVESLPWFPSLLHNNDLMFTTTDPNTLRNIAESYHVRWLVARPGTDLALSRPLPQWLVAEQDCGSLKIYQIK